MSLITERSNVIIQKGDYLRAAKAIPNRLLKFGKPREGQIAIDLTQLIGQQFGSSFKLIKQHRRQFTLEKFDITAMIDDGGDEIESGLDNRNVSIDEQTQNLKKGEIHNLVDSGASTEEMIQALTQNHKRFKSKTKFSQEKYVSKKQKKYEDFITVHTPSIRLLIRMHYMQDPTKILNLRIDSLSQMLSYANIQQGGRYIVYETGTNSLITTAMLHRIGENGNLVHVYSEATVHKGALDMMNFTEDNMRSLSFISADNLPDFSTKYEDLSMPLESNDSQDNNSEIGVKRKFSTFVRSRREDVQLSAYVLSKGVTGVVIACKQHPSAVTHALLSYLLPGHSFSVFSPYKEPLMDLYTELKARSYLNVRICENWLRNYQVLPERTHPEISMSGTGGYILFGWKVQN